MLRIGSPEELEKLRREILSRIDPGKTCISICTGSACLAAGAGEVTAAFKEEIKKQGLEAVLIPKERDAPDFVRRVPWSLSIPKGSVICR